MAELLARLRVVLRRERVGVPEQLTAGDVTIDLRRYLVYRGGHEVHLTPTEFDLLRVLASEAGKVLTHRQLLERVWAATRPRTPSSCASISTTSVASWKPIRVTRS